MFRPWFELDTAFGEMEVARRQMEHLLRSALRNDAVNREWGAVREEQDGWVVTADVPGLTAADLQMTLLDGELRVTDERKLTAPEGYEPRRLERKSWRFDRTLSLPETVDAENVSASLADGVLTIRLGRRAKTAPRTIAIGSR
jgi:HSP20 family protein